MAANPVAQQNELVRGLVNSVEELNQRTEWFRDDTRTDADNRGPFLIVQDNFYPDPEEIRDLAFKQTFVQYSPPLPEQVGDEVALKYRDVAHVLSTSLHTFAGRMVQTPYQGFRFNPDWLRQRLSACLKENIKAETWEFGGDWWNGAFHLRRAGQKVSSIHHHYKSGDVEPRGWSGVVYLSPDAPPSSGTSIWRDKSTDRCVATYGAKFHTDISNFELVYLVENRFNRLVLFRENVFHRAERGFGEGQESRLVQTFFFSSEPVSP